AMPVGNLISFMAYAAQILVSFMMLSMVFIMIPRAQASAKRIQEVFDLKSTLKEDEKPVQADKTPGNHTLEFSHVDYRYANAEKPVLTDVDFKSQSGQTIGIIGGTGSGKTSLVNLIPRFYDTEKGEIILDGKDIRHYGLNDLRDMISFVPQKAVLFRGSLRENMKFGKADATDEEIWQALDIAQATDFVKEDPA